MGFLSVSLWKFRHKSLEKQKQKHKSIHHHICKRSCTHTQRYIIYNFPRAKIYDIICEHMKICIYRLPHILAYSRFYSQRTLRILQRCYIIAWFRNWRFIRVLYQSQVLGQVFWICKDLNKSFDSTSYIWKSINELFDLTS